MSSSETLIIIWRENNIADAKVIVISEGKICDYVDGEFHPDTPKEYVRQTIEKRLINI